MDGRKLDKEFSGYIGCQVYSQSSISVNKDKFITFNAVKIITAIERTIYQKFVSRQIGSSVIQSQNKAEP